MSRGTLVTALLSVLLCGVCGIAQAAWVSLDPGSDTQALQTKVLRSNDYETVVEITIPGFMVDEVTQGGKTYQALSLLGESGTTMEVGKPQLPAVVRTLGIPDESRVEVSVVSEETRTVQGYRIFPFQQPTTDKDPTPPFALDRSFYRSNVQYPQNPASVQSPGVWRDLTVTSFKAYPIRYNPAREELTVATRMVVRVSYTGGAPGKKVIPPQMAEMYQKLILNYSDLDLEVDAGGPDLPGTRYLIFTHNSFASTIQPLAQWHQNRGMDVRVVSKSSFTSQEIKDSINAEYNRHTPAVLEYVLLVGDESYIPVYSWGGYHSDHWLVCLTGAPDHYAELAIGRFPASNTTELANYLDKTTKFIKTPPRDAWVTRDLLCAYDFYSQSEYYYCKEAIRTYPYDFDRPVFDTCYAQRGGTETYLTNALNAGRCIVNYRGHGSTTSWAWSIPWNTSSWYTLTNGDRTVIVFNIACDNHEFVGSTECLGEGAVNAPDAAVASLGATSASYTIPNHDFDKGLFWALYDDYVYKTSVCDTHQVTTLGYILNLSNAYVLPMHGSLAEANVKQYLWFGDASLDVWTKIPADFSITHPEVLLLGQTSLSVTVKLAGQPVKAALVCARKGTEVYAHGHTDQSGSVTLTVNPATVGTMYITVTAHNGIPYEGSLEVISPTGPYLLYNGLRIDDDNSGTSLGNSSDVANPGERIEMPVRVKNVGVETALSVTGTLSIPGGDPYITITDATESFGNVAVGDSVWTLDDFDFTVSPSCPHNHQINFHLDLAASNGNWTADFSVLVSGITVTATPDQTSVPRGGTLGVTLDLYNHTTAALSVDRWADVYVPNGNPYPRNPVIGPTTVSVPALSTTSAHFNLRVPRNARLGLYTMCGRAGTYPGSVVDEDCFTATVTP
jgi:hypothetical protein